ncbi:SRPBCC family protein [Roseibacillus persicicus]|uniref:Cell division protein n=1 Tax=Roseibacillus persicicus TaxID=454148 RepID=A0A918TF13_9BACT|nr:SRPBCC family protein [Roseibacillus persicicus]MDQ8192564.1 SRPBCC family protein [Roseibacillus persicicus]GHC45786.1 hypothetical protein GCM10007100_09020 [Roseibacillus persicicus]
MPLITQTTRIKAPAKRVFDLSRSIELHLQSAGDTNERAIGEITTGLMTEGQELTWEGSHLRFRQSLTVKITEFHRPDSFTDEMVKGPFSHMKHVHRFEESDEKVTTMIDEFDYSTRGGLLGWFIENSYLTAHLRRFLAERNKVIKRVAESEEWREFLKDEPLED